MIGAACCFHIIHQFLDFDAVRYFSGTDMSLVLAWKLWLTHRLGDESSKRNSQVAYIYNYKYNKMCMDVPEYDKHLFWINICRLNVSLDSPARPRNSCAFLEWLTLSLLCASMLAGSWDAYGVRNHSFSMGISHEKKHPAIGYPP